MRGDLSVLRRDIEPVEETPLIEVFFRRNDHKMMLQVLNQARVVVSELLVNEEGRSASTLPLDVLMIENVERRNLDVRGGEGGKVDRVFAFQVQADGTP